MPERKAFEFLEHMADIYVAAYGRTLEEAFENAALAMVVSMTDVKKVEPKIQDIIEVKAEDECGLLYSWLERLLIRFEVDERLYSRFDIERIEQTAEGYALKAKVSGEFFDPEKNPSKVGIKAVTYHQMEIITSPRSVTLKFILDI